jgi:hypothetical protein
VVVLLDEASPLPAKLGVVLPVAGDMRRVELHFDFSKRPANEKLTELVSRPLAYELSVHCSPGNPSETSRPSEEKL